MAEGEGNTKVHNENYKKTWLGVFCCISRITQPQYTESIWLEIVQEAVHNTAAHISKFLYPWNVPIDEVTEDFS